MEKIAIKLYFLAAIAVACLAVGAGVAWKVQGLRLDSAKSETKAVKADAKAFKDATEAEGKAAKKVADAKKLEDERKKKESDDEYENRISGLTADVKRLRNTRSSGSFVPSAASTTGSPDTACFDRPQLERAIRNFDSGLQGLVDEGSKSSIGLDVAKQWATKTR
jgi:hypothetical protein